MLSFKSLSLLAALSFAAISSAAPLPHDTGAHPPPKVEVAVTPQVEHPTVPSSHAFGGHDYKPSGPDAPGTPNAPAAPKPALPKIEAPTARKPSVPGTPNPPSLPKVEGPAVPKPAVPAVPGAPQPAVPALPAIVIQLIKDSKPWTDRISGWTADSGVDDLLESLHNLLDAILKSVDQVKQLAGLPLSVVLASAEDGKKMALPDFAQLLAALLALTLPPLEIAIRAVAGGAVPAVISLVTLICQALAALLTAIFPLAHGLLVLLLKQIPTLLPIITRLNVPELLAALS